MKLFVAKLNFKTTSASLKSLFEQYGTVQSANVVNDKVSGRSRGFGFVEMPNELEAKNAISELDQSTFEDREIVVKEAEDKPKNSGGYNGGGNRGGNDRRHSGGHNRRQY